MAMITLEQKALTREVDNGTIDILRNLRADIMESLQSFEDACGEDQRIIEALDTAIELAGGKV